MPPREPLHTPRPFPPLRPADDARPSPTIMIERDMITTISVVASATAAPTSSSTKTSFPIAIAIPALLGGMALAVAGFGIYWWLQKKRRREQRERWERRQRRHRKRANSDATRPSLSSSRNNSSGKSLNEKGIEKEPIPPVPVLLKHAYKSPGKSEQAYGQKATVQHDPPNPYPSQPRIDQPLPTDLGHPIQPSMSDLSTTPLTASRTDEPVSKPSKPSRSVARVAAAEKAAANSLADPAQRYQPKKPSPLALAAEKKANEARGMSNGYEHSRPKDANARETLMVPGDDLSSGNDGQKARQAVSGEWGVALGSPDNDGSFAAQQYGAGPNRYSSDPYLGAPDTKRAPSGHYSSDPYAAYHDADERDHYPPDGESASTKGNWV